MSSISGPALGDQRDRAAPGDGGVEGRDALVPADLEGHDHLREDDRLAQGDEGQLANRRLVLGERQPSRWQPLTRRPWRLGVAAERPRRRSPWTRLALAETLAAVRSSRLPVRSSGFSLIGCACGPSLGLRIRRFASHCLVLLVDGLVAAACCSRYRVLDRPPADRCRGYFSAGQRRRVASARFDSLLSPSTGTEHSSPSDRGWLPARRNRLLLPCVPAAARNLASARSSSRHWPRQTVFRGSGSRVALRARTRIGSRREVVRWLPR